MKKSLVILVVLVSTLAFASTVVAWDCYSYPKCPVPPCKDQVLCKGAVKGATKLCGPCAPMIKWSAKWMTLCLCPGSKMLKK